MGLLLLIHAAATLFMVGVIWFVQMVHYPLFGKVEPGVFAAYAEAHSRLTSLVVGPPMLVEAATAVVLVFAHPPAIPAWLPIVGLVLLAGVWLSTALLQVPRHRALGAGFDPGAHSLLVGSNWMRTALWSARGLVALAMISRVMA